jgi:transposase
MPRRSEIWFKLETAERVALEEAKKTASGDYLLRVATILAINSQGPNPNITIVAARVRCSPKSVYAALSLYLNGGRTPEALRPKRRGRPNDRDRWEEIRDALLQIQQETDEELTIRQYQAALKASVVLHLSEHSVRRYLRRADISWRRASIR